MDLERVSGHVRMGGEDDDDATSTTTTIPGALAEDMGDSCLPTAVIFADTVPDTDDFNDMTGTLPNTLVANVPPDMPCTYPDTVSDIDVMADTFPDTFVDPGVAGSAAGDGDVPNDWLLDDDAFGRMNGSCDMLVDEDRALRQVKRRRPTYHVGDAASSSTEMLPFFMQNCSNFGEACRIALFGAPRRRALCSMLDGTTTYKEALAFARRRVASEISGGESFYIGISENPERRFEEHLVTNGLWDIQVVLVEAASSRTTACLEVSLLSEFGKRLGCHNASGGGERPSAGSPHFLYLLVSQSGLLRRSKR